MMLMDQQENSLRGVVVVAGRGGWKGGGGAHLKGLLEVQVGEVEEADHASRCGDSKKVQVLDVQKAHGVSHLSEHAHDLAAQVHRNHVAAV